MTNPGLAPPLSSKRLERCAELVSDVRRHLDEVIAEIDDAIATSETERASDPDESPDEVARALALAS